MGALPAIAEAEQDCDAQSIDEQLPPEDDYSWFFDAAARKKYSPAERLRIAVLGDAMWCLQRRTNPSYATSANFAIKRDRKEAKAWFLGEIDSPTSFSFADVCDLIFADLQHITQDDVREAVFKAVRTRRFDIRELIFWLQ